MKRLLAMVVVILGIAISVILLALDETGYVVLTYGAQTIRLPLTLFALLVLFAFFSTYILLSMFGYIMSVPKNLRVWRRKRSSTEAQNHTLQGYAGLIEGNWVFAEQQLLSKLEHSQSTLLNYLGAAYAAQRQGNQQHRDEYLAEALIRYPKQQVAIQLVSARLHFQGGELIEAQEILENLPKHAMHNMPTAQLLADVYQALQNWNALVKLFPLLKRHKVFTPEELTSREKFACENYLSAPVFAGGKHTPTAAFESLPSATKNNSDIIAIYARQLISVSDYSAAEITIRKVLRRQWHAELAYLYGKTKSLFVDKQITEVESWIEKYGVQINITLTLARLYRYQGKLAESRDFYQRVLSDQEHIEARAELGELLEEMGNSEAALECYRRGFAELSPSALPNRLATRETQTVTESVLPVVC